VEGQPKSQQVCSSSPPRLDEQTEDDITQPTCETQQPTAFKLEDAKFQLTRFKNSKSARLNSQHYAGQHYQLSVKTAAQAWLPLMLS